MQPKKGQPATDLDPADIEIREDGKPQPIVLFQGGRARPRALPVHVDLLFDCERSALAGVPLEPELLQKHLLNAHENVAIGIYGFSGAPVRLTAPTRDPARLKKALDAAVFPRAATTFLFDQIQTVVLDAASAGPAIRMLVIFSSAQPGLGAGPRSSEKELFEPTVRIAQDVRRGGVSRAAQIAIWIPGQRLQLGDRRIRPGRLFLERDDGIFDRPVDPALCR